MGTPFKMKGMDFGNSPVKQTTSQERALQSKIAKEYKLPVSKKSSIPKGFNVTGSSKAGNIWQKGKDLVKKGFKGASKGNILALMLGSTTTATADQPKKGKGTYTGDITKMKGYKK